uniref:Uncharacterized protein n=1 Tax=Cannabis sativa TaxID=3483 RepID=A0A803QDN1_CANSA
MPFQVAGHLGVISGGPDIAGETSKLRECYAQTLHHEPKSDALAIQKRCFAENGSSSNILFKSTYEKMGLQLTDLAPYTQVIYGFFGQGIRPMGYIRLPLPIGENPTTGMLMAQFILSKVLSAFNAIIGCLALYNLKVVTFIDHLCLKFPTRHWLGCLRGHQQSTCHYYNLALCKAKKEKMSAKSSEPSKGQ